MWAPRVAQRKHMQTKIGYAQNAYDIDLWSYAVLPPENGHDFLLEMFDAKEQWVA